MNWRGVHPAITTPFLPDLEIDHEALGRHIERLLDAGCSAIVPLGSLGEGATLSHHEKLAILTTCRQVAGDRAGIVPGISALSTREACELAIAADELGCAGLMVLPPYVYSSDWREMKAHASAVIAATELPCMLYNNPLAYGADFLPEQIAELADEHANLQAVKESSTDVRRITELRRRLGDRLDVLVGIDDVIVEGVAAGAVGWIAGLVNAFPEDSVRLFEAASQGDATETEALYRWFLPLLRLDTGHKFVQKIKRAQQRVGMGSQRVRPPRLELEGAELAAVDAVIDRALEAHP
ncbi:MAG: dihydrodipicolinate synthase family protein [Acidobacteriota bacterium]